MTAVNWGRVSRPAFTAAGMLLFGGMMVNRVDIQHFLDMRRSLRSRPIAPGCCCAARDRVKYPRGTRGDGQCADCPHGDYGAA